MSEIDGINIGDVGYDRVCLNCIHWRVKTHLVGVVRGVESSMGHVFTEQFRRQHAESEPQP